MNVLILGGTRFVGKHLAAAALERGHRVTLFNRGQSDPTPRLEVEQLQGDRDGNLEALRGRRWDAVIDTSGYLPRIVRASAELLAPAVDHYTFISTASVYARGRPGVHADERAPVVELDDVTREDFENPKAYGGLKLLCERAVETIMPGRTLVARLCLVVGPLDPTDRFTYWPTRVARGGAFLAPVGPEWPVVSFIDARDAAPWLVEMIEARRPGVFNVGAHAGLTFGKLLDICRTASGAVDAVPTWVSEEFLLNNGVVPWTELPLWLPRERVFPAAFDSTKAASLGLRPRWLADTVRDVLAWDRGRAAPVTRRAGMSPHRETDLLRRWQAYRC